MAGLKRCYKEHLKKDASARGKVTLEFTVNETGRTVNGQRRSGFAERSRRLHHRRRCRAGASRCPKDKDGEATEASFAITLQLVPD